MPLEIPARVLILMDQPVVAEVVALTLHHGRFLARITPAVPEAAGLLPAWRPHLAVVDMDLGDGGLLRRLGLAGVEVPWTVPVLGLTRRGDLKTKLAAFEQGVDDIMTVPSSPEEVNCERDQLEVVSGPRWAGAPLRRATCRTSP